jgi:DNA-binding IclR family transcriptional regulator
LEERARETRDRGYGSTVEELEIGLNAVGVPVHSSDGAVVATVSVSGPAFRLPAEDIPEVAKVVKDAASEISWCLGFRG